MGYSVMTPFESIKKRNIMFNFLSKNLVSVDKLIGVQGQSESTSGPYVNEDIAYGPEGDTPVIGFNYNGSDLGKDYAFSICYWMAAIYGLPQFVEQVDKELKYILYDSDEQWYLVDAGVKLEDEACINVNEIGFRPFSTRLHSFIFKKNALKKFNQKIDAELQRLTKIWTLQIEL